MLCTYAIHLENRYFLLLRAKYLTFRMSYFKLSSRIEVSYTLFKRPRTYTVDHCIYDHTILERIRYAMFVDALFRWLPSRSCKLRALYSQRGSLSAYLQIYIVMNRNTAARSLWQQRAQPPTSWRVQAIWNSVFIAPWEKRWSWFLVKIILTERIFAPSWRNTSIVSEVRVLGGRTNDVNIVSHVELIVNNDGRYVILQIPRVVLGMNYYLADRAVLVRQRLCCALGVPFAASYCQGTLVHSGKFQWSF